MMFPNDKDGDGDRDDVDDDDGYSVALSSSRQLGSKLRCHCLEWLIQRRASQGCGAANAWLWGFLTLWQGLILLSGRNAWLKEGFVVMGNGQFM